MPYLRSFRLTCQPGQIPLVEALLDAEGYRFEPEPFSLFCRRLLAEPAPLGASLAAYFGYIYIQDRSSMLPPLALNPTEGALILDMAASPGGKTGFLAQLAGKFGAVLANEPARDRLATLRANLCRANFLSVATCSCAGEKLPLSDGGLSHILLDPPCSGWGTAAKNPQALRLWQGSKIDQLRHIQRGLLAKAARLLRPGGKLLYSTCTTNAAENQEQINWAAGELGLGLQTLQPFPGFVAEQPLDKDLLIKGEESQAQGFYLALLAKEGHDIMGTAASTWMPRTDTPWQKNIVSPQELAGPCFEPTAVPLGNVAIFSDKVRFLPQKVQEIAPQNLYWQGASLGKWQNGQFIPDARLRATLPQAANTAIVFEQVAEIRKLLTGVSLKTALAAGQIPLWWRGLPLGIVTAKNGRVLARF